MARIEGLENKYPRYLTCGDSAISVEFGDEISPVINGRIKAFYQKLSKKNIDGIEDIIPSYRAVMVNYNPQKLLYKDILKILRDTSDEAKSSSDTISKVFKIPVCYGGQYGPDLENVAKHAGLTTEEVIRIHSKKPYLIYMLGFLPGFSYLGGLDERIATPRLKTPRLRLEAGAVGIAGSQTGVYPLASPGGWQIIGQTPIKVYDPLRKVPILYEAGDYIQFVPVDEDTYSKILHEVEDGTYEYEIQTY